MVVDRPLETWCGSERFQAAVRAILAGERDLTEEEFVDSFVEEGGFHLPEPEDLRQSAGSILETFFRALEREMYLSEEGPVAIAHRNEVLHGVAHQQLTEIREMVRALPTGIVEALGVAPDQVGGARSPSEQVLDGQVDEARELLLQGKAVSARRSRSSYHSSVLALRFLALQRARNSSRRSWTVTVLAAIGRPAGLTIVLSLCSGERGERDRSGGDPRQHLCGRRVPRRLWKTGENLCGRGDIRTVASPVSALGRTSSRDLKPRSGPLSRSGGGRESNPPGTSRPPTGFEDRGAHQALVRLRRAVYVGKRVGRRAARGRA